MECEAEAVRPWLREGDELVVSGIGKVFAAAAAQRAISELGADEVVNCGLCGGFGGDLLREGRSGCDGGGRQRGNAGQFHRLSSLHSPPWRFIDYTTKTNALWYNFTQQS